MDFHQAATEGKCCWNILFISTHFCCDCGGQTNKWNISSSFRKSRENCSVVTTSVRLWRTEFCCLSKWRQKLIIVVFIQKSSFHMVWMSISLREKTGLEPRELVREPVQLLIFNHSCITAENLAMNSPFVFMWAQSCRCNTELMSAETQTNKWNMLL